MRRMTAAGWLPVGKDRVSVLPRWLLFSVRTVQESPISCERCRSSLGLSAPVSRWQPTPVSPMSRSTMTPRFKEATRLKLWLSGNEIFLTQPKMMMVLECPYCYELTIGNGDNRNVLSESIFYWPTSSGRKTRLIERLGDGTVKAGKVFGLSGYRGALEKILRPNASVISTLAQLNHPVASKIVLSASMNRSNIFIEKVEFQNDIVLQEYIARPEMTKEFNREISRVDVGVRGLEVLQGNDGPQLRFQHEGLAVPMPFFLESHGTQQFLKLFPLISDSLAMGSIAIIDELDAAIHSMILPEIIGWFHDPVATQTMRSFG